MFTILNDLHMGVTRTAGTTPKSAAALGENMLAEFQGLLEDIDSDLIILGDLFDKFNVDLRNVYSVFGCLNQWLRVNRQRKIILVAGNHDLSKDSSRMGAFEIVGKLLQSFVDDRVVVVRQPMTIEGTAIHIIPHLPNQDLFDMALDKVPADSEYILLHANYDNEFAVEADHSLNVSHKQAKKLPGTLVFAHEHQRATHLQGKVQVIGNQIPSSVADFIGGQRKYYCYIDNEGISFPEIDVTGQYAEIDWRELKANPTGRHPKFVRVVGTASAQEGAQVVTRIAKYRQVASSFVVSNAAKVEAMEGMIALPSDLDTAKAFDVIEAILSQLDPSEQKAVRQLLQENPHE